MIVAVGGRAVVRSGAGCAATVPVRGQLIGGEGGGWRQPGPEYSGACYFTVPISGGAGLHDGLSIFASPDERPKLVCRSENTGVAELKEDGQVSCDTAQTCA